MVKPEPLTRYPAVPERVMPVPAEMVEVAIDPRVEGVPEPVQYASCPMVGVDEVETLPVKRVAPSNPSNVPVQLPVALRVKAPPVFCNPEPKSEVNEDPPMLRLVVEAVTKEA